MRRIITPEENVKLVYETAASEILKYTPQLYIIQNGNIEKPKPFGSSILFSRDGDYYLITAAHCIKQKNNLIKIGVMISGKFYFVKGTVVMNKGQNDSIDIAAVKLENETVEILKDSYQFISKRDILSNKNIENETEYLIVGFPISKTSIDYKMKRIKTEPFVFISKSKDENSYLKQRINDTQNILLGFSKRRSAFVGENEMNISPTPTGISGCGLWYIPSYFSEKVVFKLSGIMIDYYHKTNMMLATKVEEIMKLISLFSRN